MHMHATCHSFVFFFTEYESRKVDQEVQVEFESDVILAAKKLRELEG